MGGGSARRPRGGFVITRTTSCDEQCRRRSVGTAKGPVPSITSRMPNSFQPSVFDFLTGSQDYTDWLDKKGMRLVRIMSIRAIL
jgi:hypothetical protein